MPQLFPIITVSVGFLNYKKKTMLAKFTPVLVLVMLLCQAPALFAESNSDDVLFHIECPPDVTVDCDAELWDLSIYGWAYVHGYGSPVPASDPVVTYHLNSCGTGHIARTWTAYDYQNNPHSCTQYIHVGGGAFDGYHINWPPNYTSDDCNGSLDPDDLPPPYNYPTYDNVDCSMIMIGHEDLVFDFGGGCKKILRKWSVVDWCTYNPNYPYGGGRWEYTQVLKIKPDGSLLLDCPDDITISAGANCSGTYVTIPPATGTGACGSGVNVTNNSPYASAGGANASGHYPYGTTWVTFTAEDACGNWESCMMKITVRDMKKPTPICYNGLTANLMMNIDGYYIDLDPEWFNKGSFDNCTPDHLLEFRIEPSRFDCTMLGEQDVKVYVKDQDGNEQYCNTYVVIQDNMGMCPPVDTTSFSLAGQLLNLQGLPISDMSLELMEDGDMIDEELTSASGEFEFQYVLNNGDYMVKPVGSDEYTLGLSTFDLLKLAKHINGINTLSTTGELFAADANQDGEVDVQDLLVLRKLLLNYTTTLPNSRAWRFIPTDILSDGDEDMLYETIEEYWTIEDLYENVNGIDFTAIKIGDINGSVQSLNSAEERSAKPVFKIKLVQKEDKIDFISTQNISINGMQMDLNFMMNEMMDVQTGAVQLNKGHMRSLEDHTLVSWYDAKYAHKIKSGDVLFSIASESLQADRLELLTMLDGEVYSAGEVIYSIELETEKSLADVSEGLFEVQVFPNPSVKGQFMQLVSDTDALKDITIFDGTGNMIQTIDGLGLHEVAIPTQNLNAGLYLIQAKSVTGQSVYRKIMLKE